MKYSIGQKVKIKPYSEIKSSLNHSGESSDGCYFNELGGMQNHCQYSHIVERYQESSPSRREIYYKLKGIERVRSEEWLQSADKPPKIIKTLDCLCGTKRTKTILIDGIYLCKSCVLKLLK